LQRVTTKLATQYSLWRLTQKGKKDNRSASEISENEQDYAMQAYMN